MRYFFLLGILLGLSRFAYPAQRGTAESGYYPTAYYGSTFTGALTSANDETREITLTYTDSKSNKTETFVGVLEEEYILRNKTGKLVQLLPSLIKPGVTLKVYFLTKEQTVGGRKVKFNVIFKIKDFTNHREQFTVFKPFTPGTTAEIVPSR